MVYVDAGSRALADSNTGQHPAAIGSFPECVVVDQEFFTCKVAAVLILVNIEVVPADRIPVPKNDVIPGFIFFTGMAGAGDGMAVVVEQVGFNQGISAIQVDAIPFTACLVVVDIIVVDEGNRSIGFWRNDTHDHAHPYISQLSTSNPFLFSA